MISLQRQVANIYIPPVSFLKDTKAVEQMFAIHCEQKMLFNDLITGKVDHEEILEALELFVGTNYMDDYISSVELQLEKTENNVLQYSN